jgi:hypothetical protein
VLILLLLGISAAVVLPRFGGGDFMRRLELKTAASGIAADMRHTRALAVAESEDHELEFDFQDRTYGIYDDSGDLVGEIKSIPSHINLSGTTRFTFKPLGNCSFRFWENGTVNLASGVYSYEIEVFEVSGLPSVKPVNP